MNEINLAYHIDLFEDYLYKEEKSKVTIEKYLRDVKRFVGYVKQQNVTKALVVDYKESLQREGYAVASINSMLASLNCFFDFLKWQECKVKGLKVQRKIYASEEKELTKAEYFRLLNAAKNQPQLYMILQTICSTGIRISELKYFTLESVQKGKVNVQCKRKIREVFLTGKLKRKLLDYAKKYRISSGALFITKNGKHLDRSNIWLKMKKLCEKACVAKSKVFPHNLRKLFAKTFYEIEKDIAKLADILGHSNIETTRIYIMTTGIKHRQKMEQMGLVI